MYGQVYRILNRRNNLVYIGQTRTSLKKRWQALVSKARHANWDKQVICTAISEFGPDAFLMESLILAKSQEELDYYEQEWIEIFESYNPEYGYNRSKGGFGAGIMLEEVRLKFCKMKPPNQLGKKRTEETKRKISKAKRGVPHKNKRIYSYLNQLQLAGEKERVK